MKINKLIIDSSYAKTELCELGVQYPTDKSPYVENYHRHPYSAVYDLLFFHLKDKEITFAELGIYKNQSIKCWRKYFLKASLYAFDNDQEHINNALSCGLQDSHYFYMSVDSEESIQQGFSHTNKSFDIIIDDSSHKFNDQIRIIKNSYSFLKPGGMLIIEDIFRRVPDQKYIEAIGEYEKYFDRITFILCEHQNRYSDGWDNDKILVLVRNDNN